MMMERFALVVDLGGTKIAVARVGSAGRITHRLLAPTPSSGCVAVVEAISNLLTQLPARGTCAVGVAVPGVAYPDGTVWAPNIPGWKQMPLARMLRERLDLPVLVDSDRNAFVIGEKWKGLAQDCRDIVFVIIGTGIGAGIISGGQLLRGHGELSGCAGRMAVRDEFLPGYETVGCLEFHFSGPGIARAAFALLARIHTLILPGHSSRSFRPPGSRTNSTATGCRPRGDTAPRSP